jgi:hypothetical protein
MAQRKVRLPTRSFGAMSKGQQIRLPASMQAGTWYFISSFTGRYVY